MRVIEIRDQFGIDLLTVGERAEPMPVPGQVVIKLRAVSLNYRDLLVVNGVRRWRPSLSRIPASDGVGVVVAFVGLLIGMETVVDLVTLMGKSARVQSIDVGSREMFEAMNRAIRFHRMRPVVDRVFDFSETTEAFRHLAGARHFSKICVCF